VAPGGGGKGALDGARGACPTAANDVSAIAANTQNVAFTPHLRRGDNSIPVREIASRPRGIKSIETTIKDSR
jgi:hypothetical protein